MTTWGGHWLIEQSEAERTFKMQKPQEEIELSQILIKSLKSRVILGVLNLLTSCTASTPGLHCPAD